MITDQLTDNEVYILTLYGEARGEPIEGQVAVAWVIKNRATSAKKTIKEICLAKEQFSCWNKDDPNYPILQELGSKLYYSSVQDPIIDQISYIVNGVLTNKIMDNSRGAHYYLTKQLFHYNRPYWAKIILSDPVDRGNHVFFNV